MGKRRVLPSSTLYAAYTNWCAYHNLPCHMLGRKRVTQFERFVGAQFIWGTDKNKPLPEVTRRVEMLASPHYHALMKAWEINNKPS